MKHVYNECYLQDERILRIERLSDLISFRQRSGAFRREVTNAYEKGDLRFDFEAPPEQPVIVWNSPSGLIEVTRWGEVSCR